jgi:uncharacterized protein (TIGR03067 family)
MTVRFAALLAIILSLSAQADDPDRNAPLTDQEGLWQAVSFVRDGKASPDAIVRPITREVRGGQVVWRNSGKAFAGTSLRVDSSARPRTMDLVPDGGPNQDKTALGIYELDGPVLILCVADLGQPRPSEFASPKGSRTTLMRLLRVPPPPKKPRGGLPGRPIPIFSGARTLAEGAS